MPQIINGILLGASGLPGTRGVFIFRNQGDPNTLTTDPNLYSCALGSLYLRYDVGELWQCTTEGIPATPQGSNAVPGVWTKIS